jgi:photosystem II stability/assembly factor-like uncharacterized protein
VSEFQPNIQQGGRANTIAVYPDSNNIIFVASDTGGLFRSLDWGVHWQHVDSLPCFGTNSVAFMPSRVPGELPILFVTTSDDYKVTGGGGIWRSLDVGRSWTPSSVTFPSDITGRLSAYEISIVPDGSAIYVASEFGSLMSTDRGASWMYQDVFGSGVDRRTISILALGDNRVIAGGPSGIRRSSNGGATWNAPATTTVGGLGTQDIHAFGRSPISRRHAYVVNSSANLFTTQDGGNTWLEIVSAPRATTCGGFGGGIAFIKAVPRTTMSPTFSRSLHLYFSNRCEAFRLNAPINSLTGNPRYDGTWQALTADHYDTRDLAFDDATNPVMLATDGGLHKTRDGGDTWTHAGNGPDGYNAVQITEVTGQLIEDISRRDLYFGTQDNSVYASGDGGTTWPHGRCCEGYYVELLRRVPTASDSKVTFVACDGPCVRWISDPLFTANVDPWQYPRGDGAPVILERSLHVQVVNSSLGFSHGLAITADLGRSWRQWATFPSATTSLDGSGVDSRGITKVARAGSESMSSIVYQPYRAGWLPGRVELQSLMRIEKVPGAPTADVYFPRMTNFGALGINRTMFAQYQVFAIDPGDPLHIIAPDVINERVMETFSGGEEWTELPELGNLASDSGRLLFTRSIYPNISAISFSPQNPNLVLAGTIQGGIYFSTDGGRHWDHIPSSERVTYVTSFHWLSANEIVVSTYGRGLWRLRSRLVSPLSSFEILCEAPCFEFQLVPKQKPDPKLAILIYEGRVVGARTTRGILREVFVTPGSSVLFVGGVARQELEIKVTEINREMGFGRLQSRLKPPKEGWIVKGLVFGEDSRLQGAVFGDKPMVITQRKSDQGIQVLKGETKSPVAGKPYLSVVTERFRGGPTATPDELIQLTGVNFPRDAVLEIVVDGQPVDAKIQANTKGLFSMEIRAPREMGPHSLEARFAAGNKAVLDGLMFFVTHVGDFKASKSDQK